MWRQRHSGGVSSNSRQNNPDDRNTDVGRRCSAGLRRCSNGRVFPTQNPGQPWRLFQISTTIERCSALTLRRGGGDQQHVDRAAGHGPGHDRPHDRRLGPPSLPRRVGGCGEAGGRGSPRRRPRCGVRDDVEPPPFASPGLEGSTTAATRRETRPARLAGGPFHAIANIAAPELSRPKPGTRRHRRPRRGLDRRRRSVNYR